MLKLYTWMHEKESGVSTEVTTKKPFVYTEPLTTLIYIYNPLPKNVWTLFTKPPICFWWVINYFPTLLFYYIYLYDMIYYIYDYIYIVIYIYHIIICSVKPCSRHVFSNTHPTGYIYAHTCACMSYVWAPTSLSMFMMSLAWDQSARSV